MTPTPRSSARAHYDVASAISIGRRDCQEDAIVADFPQGAEHGFVVLADGMGGHAAGDIASKIVVTEVFSELKLQSGDPVRFERDINAILRAAVRTANDCVLNHATSYPRTNGMGATLLAPVLLGDWLHWISVGDSPLYLYRDGVLRQVNEDHSLAPQIDHMVRSGLMQPERGRTHPDRNCLTSVLIGMEIPRIDCPAQPIALKPGDIVVSIGPSYGKTMVVPPDLDGANLTQGTARIAPADSWDVRFLRWSLDPRTSLERQELPLNSASMLGMPRDASPLHPDGAGDPDDRTGKAP